MPRNHHTELAEPVFAQPVFNEKTQTIDQQGFQTPFKNDDLIYKQIQDLLSKDVVSFDKSRMPDNELYSLETAYGSSGKAVTGKINAAKRIVFHAVGDTGATTARKYQNEVAVADQLTQDALTQETDDKPCFLFHLGDVVYDFGESQYYYDQFYEPYRNYPAPIFAIPGNHDSFIVPGTVEADEPLKIFARNFCSESTVITKEARSLHRTAMTQPGVYFTLDAPFVRVIALFSNSLEDPGVISSVNKKYKNVPDYQLEFLKAQLDAIAKENYKGAVILATHHPAFTYAAGSGSSVSDHGSSSEMLGEIDAICEKAGVYPHAFLSGHAHNYQRYTRTFKFGGKEIDVPFIVCGNSGHNVSALARAKRGQPSQDPRNGADVSYLDSKSKVGNTTVTLEKYDDRNSGYLRVSVDQHQLRISFHETSDRILQSRFDLVTVDLATHAMVAN